MADVNELVQAKARVGGLAYRADLGTALPVDAFTVLVAGYKALGIAGEDGVSFSEERSTEDVKDMNGNIVRTLQTEYGHTFTVALISSANDEVKKLVHGETNVTITPATSLVAKSYVTLLNSKELPTGVIVLESADEVNNVLIRRVYPIAKVTEVGEYTWVGSDVVRHELTIKAYPDAAGNAGYEYERVGEPTA